MIGQMVAFDVSCAVAQQLDHKERLPNLPKQQLCVGCDLPRGPDAIHVFHSNRRFQLSISTAHTFRLATVLLPFLSVTLACQFPGQPNNTALPPLEGQPLAFTTEVLRVEPTTTLTAIPVPTLTPAETPTPAPAPTNTALPSTATATIEPLFTLEPTETTTTLDPTPRPLPTDPPLRGGSWDLEDGFVDWINPYGDDCSGSKIAVGWHGFTSRGAYGSSCFVQNDFAPNVQSGRFSQEITFDFVDSHAGLFRTIATKAGHRYRVVAHLKHVPSISPLQFQLGVDLSGGVSWEAGSLQWFPWRENSENRWAATAETVTATGPTMTVYIKGFHPNAEQGGATFVDNVTVTDLGP
jgi:hypothetical protein